MSLKELIWSRFAASTTFTLISLLNKKLEYIQSLQNQHKKVAMVGDGLNDAGALKQSNVGIAIADDSNSFHPSSDIIMNGDMLGYLPDFFRLSKDVIRIVKATFIISLLYNVVGLYTCCNREKCRPCSCYPYACKFH